MDEITNKFNIKRKTTEKIYQRTIVNHNVVERQPLEKCKRGFYRNSLEVNIRKLIESRGMGDG